MYGFIHRHQPNITWARHSIADMKCVEKGTTTLSCQVKHSVVSMAIIMQIAIADQTAMAYRPTTAAAAVGPGAVRVVRWGWGPSEPQ